MATQVTQPQAEVDQESGKFVYSYQPMDADNQPIGKPYRFLYTDHQDLVQQLTEAKANGDRFIHEVKTGKRRLQGEPAPPPAYQPAPESQDEAEKKARELFRLGAEKELGESPERIRKDMQIAKEVREFISATTWAAQNEANGYYVCPQNGKLMATYLKENNLAYTDENLTSAFEELKGKLITKPSEQAPPADSTQQPPAPTREPAKPQSTGIIPGQFQGTRPGMQPKQLPLTVDRYRQINRMGLEDFRRLQRTNPKEYELYLQMKAGALPQQ